MLDVGFFQSIVFQHSSMFGGEHYPRLAAVNIFKRGRHTHCACDDAQQVMRVKDMYAAILSAGVMGYALNVLFLISEKRIVHWSGR